jgi:hypothetical protein
MGSRLLFSGSSSCTFVSYFCNACCIKAALTWLKALGIQLLHRTPCLIPVHDLQVCHTGDALSEGSTVPGGFSGIIVDIFANGALPPTLTEVNHKGEDKKMCDD